MKWPQSDRAAMSGLPASAFLFDRRRRMVASTPGCRGTRLVGPFLCRIAAARNDRQGAFILDLLTHLLAVVGLVGGDRQGLGVSSTSPTT